MSRKRNRWSLRRVISLVLAALLIAGVVTGISAIVSSVNDDKKEISPDFERGGIDEKGKAFETNGSLYTPEAFEAKGLEIKLEFDSHLSYQIFWYDEHDVFKSCTEVMTSGGEWFTPANCRARIMLIPLWDELDDDDNEIGWFDVWGYTSDIEIRVDKDQTIPKTAYKKIGLVEATETGMFAKHENKYYDPGVHQVTWQTAEGVEFYIFANDDGKYSAMFMEGSDGVVLEKLEIVVTLHDGSVVQYYYDGTPRYASGNKNGGIPTYEDPLAIPKGASVYILFDGNAVSAEDLQLYFY